MSIPLAINLASSLKSIGLTCYSYWSGKEVMRNELKHVRGEESWSIVLEELQ